MKKNLFFPTAATVTALALASCGSKPAAPQTVEGAVLDASMNNITLVTTAGDTLNISTMNADPAKVPGVTVGDSVSVTCAETDADGVKVMQAQELTVKSGSSDRRIQGEWTEPNPIDSAAVQGFRLNPDGTAESIGMATLQITAWTLTDGKTLILRTTSIGNKQTIEGQDTLTVDKLDADSLVLSNGSGYVQWRLARQQ